MAASIQHQPTSSLLLTPRVLEKLELIQQKPQQTMMIRLTPSKSAENKPQTQLVHPEKSTSLTLAQRRNNNNIPASLKLSLKSASVKELVKDISLSSQVSPPYPLSKKKKKKISLLYIYILYVYLIFVLF
jgi:hypothetical protein